MYDNIYIIIHVECQFCYFVFGEKTLLKLKRSIMIRIYGDTLRGLFYTNRK